MSLDYRCALLRDRSDESAVAYPTLLDLGQTRLTAADILLDSLGSKALGTAIPPIEVHALPRFLRRISTTLAVLAAAAVPCAHAQTPSSAVETGIIATSRATGAEADVGVTATPTIATGNAKTNDNAVGVGRPKIDASDELPPFHPLTDF